MSETNQHPGEPIATYVEELRRIARHSAFGTNWDDCLHDRVVCGLSNTHIRKNCLWRRTSTFPKPFSWLQRPRQPLVMRWSLGRRLSLGRCTSLHLLRGDDQRRFCSLVHRHGLAHLQSRRSVSLVVTPVIVCNMVSAAICDAMHVARRGHTSRTCPPRKSDWTAATSIQSPFSVNDNCSCLKTRPQSY